jgi:putative ABC transport system permease protein
MLKAFGIDLGHDGIVISPRRSSSACSSASSRRWSPASCPPARDPRRAGGGDARRVTPGVGHLRRRRIVGSLALMGLGLLALFYGLFGGIDSTRPPRRCSAWRVLMMFGVAFLAPLLVRPLARGLGAPLAAAGPDRQLARENAIRQPQRTAVTAAALMTAWRWSCSVTVFAAEHRASVTKANHESVSASLIVQNQDGSRRSAAGRRHRRPRSTASRTSRPCASRPGIYDGSNQPVPRRALEDRVGGSN